MEPTKHTNNIRSAQHYQLLFNPQCESFNIDSRFVEEKLVEKLHKHHMIISIQSITFLAHKALHNGPINPIDNTSEGSIKKCIDTSLSFQPLCHISQSFDLWHFFFPSFLTNKLINNSQIFLK